MPVSVNSKNSILIVDQKDTARSNLASILVRAGYSVCFAEELLTLHQRSGAGGHFCLILLSLGLVGVQGLDILRKIQGQYPNVPVLVLAAENKKHLAVDALNLGADGYLIEPIDPILIYQRVIQILNREKKRQRRNEILSQIQELVEELTQIQGHKFGGVSPSEPFDLPELMPQDALDPDRYLKIGNFILDSHTHQVHLMGRCIDLSPTNFDYLHALACSSPEAVSIKSLASQAQRYELTAAEAHDLVRWRIHELRKAIEPDPHAPQFIITVRGKGYRLVTS